MKLPEVVHKPLGIARSTVEFGLQTAESVALLELKVAFLVAKIGVRGGRELAKQTVFWTKFLIETDIAFAKLTVNLGIDMAVEIVLIKLLEMQAGGSQLDPGEISRYFGGKQGRHYHPTGIGSDISFG